MTHDVQATEHRAGPLFHLALPADWQEAAASGVYAMSTRGVTLREAGFVHCSFADQWPRVLARSYGDLEEVLLLTLDVERLRSAVVVEDLDGSGEAFPHVYGPIPVDAVTTVRAVRPAAMGDAVG